MRVILGSGSPRRKELMDLLNIKYEIIVSNEDETLEEGLSIEEQSKKLAYIKAKSVFNNTAGNRIVIGSDTMVVKNNKLYGKPKDRDDAVRMINELKNTKHQIITSVCILIEKDEEYYEYVDYDIADIYIDDLSEEEINKWIDSGEAMDKAGAYAVQSKFGVFVSRIDGNYNSVVGLSVDKVYKILKQYIDI